MRLTRSPQPCAPFERGKANLDATAGLFDGVSIDSAFREECPMVATPTMRCWWHAVAEEALSHGWPSRKDVVRPAGDRGRWTRSEAFVAGTWTWLADTSGRLAFVVDTIEIVVREGICSRVRRRVWR